MTDINWNLGEFEAIWAERERAVERAKQGIDVRGMTRPARDMYERQWLDERGDRGPFRETTTPPVRSGRERKPRTRRAS